MTDTRPARATRAGVAGAAALALGVLASGAAAAPAHADSAPWVFAGFAENVIVGADGAPGKIYLAHASGQGAVHPRVVFDVSGLAGVATVDFLPGCETAGSTVTCAVDDGTSSFEHVLPITFHPARGAKGGETGTIGVHAVADNTEQPPTSTTVTVTDGVDLVASSLDEGSLPDARPGDTRYSRFGWFNLGNRTAQQQTIVFDVDSGLLPVRYEGCTIRAVGRQHEESCTLNAVLDPGRDNGYEWVTVDTATGKETPGFATTVGPDALGEKGIDFYVGQPAAASAKLRHAVPAQSGPANRTFKLVPAHRIVRPKASGNTEIDNSNNFGFSDYHVNNASDIATIGATASGKVGDVRPVTIGVHNNGRGSLDGSRAAEPVLSYIFQPPPGTDVTAAPRACWSIVEINGQTQVPVRGKPHGTYYRCETGITLDAGQRSTVTFQLKITKVIADATGTVGFYDRYASPPDWFKDDNPANDKAPVVVNPGTGGQGGGTGGPTLPITGAQTGLFAGVGAALLAVGGVLYMAARRRRTVLVPERTN